MPGVSIALQNDATQPINVKAQAVLIDEKKGISIYTGKAIVAQGSLILSAEKIQLFSNQTQVTKMIANGNKKQRA
ncbi:LptA/OstA family protein, partial [Candidatus Thioglobus sp.]|nr:LptA/OstA family protein [Candidatus Thioglobus sp.]